MPKEFPPSEVNVAVVDVLVAWAAFKKGHDINSMMMKCCDVSAMFFDSLEHLESLIDLEVEQLGLKKEKE